MGKNIRSWDSVNNKSTSCFLFHFVLYNKNKISKFLGFVTISSTDAEWSRKLLCLVTISDTEFVPGQDEYFYNHEEDNEKKVETPKYPLATFVVLYSGFCSHRKTKTYTLSLTKTLLINAHEMKGGMVNYRIF